MKHALAVLAAFFCPWFVGAANAQATNETQQGALIPSAVSVVASSRMCDFGPNIAFDRAKPGPLMQPDLFPDLAFANGAAGQREIEFITVPATGVYSNPEAYGLSIDCNRITVRSSSAAGGYYAVQSLSQLAKRTSAGTLALPAGSVSDAPRFAWRGVLLDVSRHFFEKQAVLRLLDEMGRYKLNVLHLHLTDDPGWRIEIPGYPRLTDIGARGDRSNPESEPQFYTAADIREIVAYAAQRNIMVVPEIDMPGHSAAAARAYPEFFDGNKTFNPANEKSYEFIRAVLTEVSRLFPSPYIHFGGDEVRQENWATMPDVLALQQREGLRDKQAIEGYFGRRVGQIVTSLGKRPMAWDEQASAGADKGTLIQWWRKYQPEVRDAAVKAGYEVVLSPADQVYFDYPQGPGEPGAPWEGNDNGPTSLAKILAWEPIPASYGPSETARVKGVEAALWSEFIRSEDYLEFMAFPRLLAFAEVAWSPRGTRDLNEFNTRLVPHLPALRARGINARRSEEDAAPYMAH